MAWKNFVSPHAIAPRRRVVATAPAILAECGDKSRVYLPGQSDAMGDGKLVYAVYAAAGRDSRNRKDRRFVEENVSDELLLRNVAEGDKAAMHIMYARHRTKVFRFIQRIVRNTAVAEDLVSQVFLDVWRSANRFENRARVSTWLLSIARLKALSTLRGQRYENVVQDNFHGMIDDADTPEVALDRKKTKATLRACIEKLSPAHREIIDLIYYRETSVAEASEIVGIPHATVKSRIFYARKQLARILVSIGFEVEAIQASVHKTREATPPWMPSCSAPQEPTVFVSHLRVVIDRKALPPTGSRGDNARNFEKVKPQE
jgi:RNA polymerase sigma-70 factor, ECF subfamily